MRSYNLRIVVCAILLTGYALGQNLPSSITLNEGELLRTAVLTFGDEVKKCYLETPSGLVVTFKPDNESNEKFELLPDSEISGCQANILNLDSNDIGLWTLTSESGTGEIRSQSYSLTVNPQVNQDAEVEYLQEETISTSLGTKHVIFISDYGFVQSEKCYLIVPSGKRYILEELDLPGIKTIQQVNAPCAIEITVDSEDVVGNWTLISEGTRFSNNIERRKPFIIHVEETVEAFVSEVVVVKGNDFYPRLKNAILNYDTCKLLGPNGKKLDRYENDNRFIEKCGYIVRELQTTDGGEWEIVYGNKIIYRAPIKVTVSAATSEGSTNLKWTIGQSVEEALGPENSVHCSVESPQGIVIYNGFGRCRIAVDRVSMAHNGIWKMNVNLPGRILSENMEFNIEVVKADPKPVVSTQVMAIKPAVSLTCKVSSPNPIRACKFRDPSGRVLLASEGVGESRYTFHGSGVSFESNLHTHDCGLKITEPVVADLGLWRCALETEGDTYYGFLSVLCPWALRDPEVAAAVIREPTLTADNDVVSSVVGDSVSMSCSVQSAIRYCYFRSSNGTIFNVAPGDSHDQATYLGAGLDAGECGISFSSLAVTDTGSWSCHVGLADDKQPEQRVAVRVNIQDAMVAAQEMEGDNLLVKAQVHDQKALDYCRFVRIDGLGFTTANIPDDYSNLSILSQGKCGISKKNPTILDHHPWTVVARLKGQDVELSRVTQMTLEVPNPPTPPLPPGVVMNYQLPVAWMVVMAVGLCMVLLAILLGPKNNRRWTYSRTSAIRNSFMRKAVVSLENNPEKNTATAA